LIKETLNKSAFYGEPAQLCDAGINKIKVLAPLSCYKSFRIYLISASLKKPASGIRTQAFSSK